MKPFSVLLALCEGHRWVPLTNDRDADLWCFLLSAPEQAVKQTIETLVI